MKVLQIVNTGIFSGAENVVCQIINAFKNDIEMGYCGYDGPIKNVLEEYNIKFFPIKKMSVAELKRVIKQFSPDVIHTHDMRASFFTALACGKIPLVNHIHNNAFDSRAISLKSILYLYAAFKAKHIFWVSKTSFEGYCFHNFFQKKSSILQNVINVDSLIKKKNEDSCNYNYDVVFVGRLTFPKNPERLIEVFGKLAIVNPDVRCAIIGNGELSDVVENLIIEKKLERNVFMLGFKKNPLKILCDSKALLMTSRWEGLPMCALEALALGVPVVSTPVDGLLTIIQHGVNGFLSDNDDDLVNDLNKIICDKELRESLSNNCIQLSNEYNNLKAYKNNIEGIYKKVVP